MTILDYIAANPSSTDLPLSVMRDMRTKRCAAF